MLGYSLIFNFRLGPLGSFRHSPVENLFNIYLLANMGGALLKAWEALSELRDGPTFYVLFLGFSGSGKTTILRSMVGKGYAVSIATCTHLHLWTHERVGAAANDLVVFAMSTSVYERAHHSHNKRV